MVPKGLLIGQVQQINRADNAVFQSAIVHGLVDPSRAELVFVVRASQ
jgi:cell shape-determining protein MreC